MLVVRFQYPGEVSKPRTPQGTMTATPDHGSAQPENWPPTSSIERGAPCLKPAAGPGNMASPRPQEVMVDLMIILVIIISTTIIDGPSP